VIWRSARASATMVGSRCASEVRMMIRHHGHALLNHLVEVLRGESEVELAGLDP
jgi:DNA-directed RNA polymerase subunit L